MPNLINMKTYLIKDITLVNEGKTQVADILLKNKRIEKIGRDLNPDFSFIEINGKGKYLIPGVIDDQVHFREPGLTHKAEISTESRAAVAGGVTSFMDMPNVVPPSLSLSRLEERYQIAAQKSLANYSFYLGVSNENQDEALRINDHKEDICGLKIFMGSSTGNMLVDNIVTLEKIFSESEKLIATHCEKEELIQNNMERVLKENPEPDVSFHPVIRDVAACYESSLMAVQMAMKFDTRLHILHISTAKELELFSNMLPLAEKRITTEVCVHHLYFSSDDYSTYGNLIKCNPAIKPPENRDTLWQGLLDDRLDIIATDHAPHTREEKSKTYLQAPSGIPLVQHSLLLMLEMHKKGKISLEKIVEKMCHAPAVCFGIKERGFLREGYYADCVMIDLEDEYNVTAENVRYKCQWSPFENHRFPAKILNTFVNGHLAFDGTQMIEGTMGSRLKFG